MSRASTSALPTDKIPLPAFLQMLVTGSGCTMQQAMAIAAKIYKAHGTPEQLGQLSTLQLEAMGLGGNDCKAVMTAIAKAGYKAAAKGKASTSTAASTGSSTPARKKRKRVSDLDSPLPSTSNTKEEHVDLSFDEVLDEQVLTTKSVVVNRAPVMNAWAMIVCERLGFQRAEALSIGAAYTEMNAISKGVSIGVFDPKKGKGVELAKTDSQPFVDIMGRRISVMKTRNDTWRALVKGEPVDPAEPHGYIKRAFRQTLPHVLGAMRLLAQSFAPSELNDRGYGLYAEFRPSTVEWGARSEMQIDNILSLRKSQVVGAGAAEVHQTTPVVHEAAPEEASEPLAKRAKPTEDTIECARDE
ncbi:hypothetical protein EXIGLDRAFT_716214 [Exidia glandulosa HHB12029]|uniref:Uncharacterized protein n=1 Tax=Exidia glandulosa HHB12029 TaxID=1314781 RepID=A0A165QXW6_EXIGL|nr:hypothetical protein EXIGLDRAFT_716214 [Exidia glandulosa HHB12029]